MMRWLASLSYHTISEQAGQYLIDPALVGKSDTEGLAPALNPKAAVFEVRIYATQFKLYTYTLVHASSRYMSGTSR